MPYRTSRRKLIELAVTSGVGSACGANAPDPRQASALSCAHANGGDDVDYVVVGSGAGGGPVAANLARKGFRVVVLEAGPDPNLLTTQVPALHAAAVEEAELRWDFYARMYGDDTLQSKNPRFVREEDGVLYPRAAALGGCTVHNALITLTPHDSDWDDLARRCRDDSFRAANMRRYFERLERCEYAPVGGNNEGRHGSTGWLRTNTTDLWLGLSDAQILAILDATFEEANETNPNFLCEAFGMAISQTRGLLDPNDPRFHASGGEGAIMVPLHVADGRRNGPREYLREVERACPGNLRIVTSALATRVIFDDAKRAVGVAYFEGGHLYQGSARAARPGAVEEKVLRVRREVILAGGVFCTPQLLMLSGVGPADELARFDLPRVAELEGVGKNLQDRYEFSVVSEMAREFSVTRGASLLPPDGHARHDAPLEEWKRAGTGPYSSNGVVGALIRRSRSELADPDLFLFGLVGDFRGYYHGYSRDLVASKSRFTWGILKGHTDNVAGVVRLASADPRERPKIQFNAFDASSPGAAADLDAMVEGVMSVRRIMRRAGTAVAREVYPGLAVRTREQIAQIVREQAWGHHACGTCKMGTPDDKAAVVDSRFRVLGVSGLRIVDASVFPRIPGFFIVSSVYMLAEKASDVIAQDAR